MNMPTKLKVLVGVLAVSAIWNLASGLWIPAILGAMLVAGVLKANDGARIAVMVVSVLGLLAVAVLATLLPGQLPFTVYTQLGLPPALALWVMTRADVRRWFFLRG